MKQTEQRVYTSLPGQLSKLVDQKLSSASFRLSFLRSLLHHTVNELFTFEDEGNQVVLV